MGANIPEANDARPQCTGLDRILFDHNVGPRHRVLLLTCTLQPDYTHRLWEVNYRCAGGFPR